MGLTSLLVLVAVASRPGNTPSAGAGSGPSDTVWDYFLSAYLVVGSLVFVTLIYLLARERESLPTRRGRRQIRQLVQFGLVMLVLVLVFGGREDLWNRLSGDDQGKTRPAQTKADRKRRARDQPQDSRFRWEPVIVIAALGAAAGVALLAGSRSRSRASDLADEEFADALAAVLDEALADLRAERDPRKAIIAAYARMERLLGAHGVPRRPSEAPFEYLARVLLELQVSSSSVFDLTELFERAKFSPHEIDLGMRDEAITALAAVRDELRGTA